METSVLPPPPAARKPANYCGEPRDARATVAAMAVLVALVVASLSLAGDAIGATTPAGLGTKSAEWERSCCVSGVSASTPSFSCGIAASLLTVFSTIGGCVASAGACFCAAPPAVSRSLRAFAALWGARAGMGGGLALYAYILMHLGVGLVNCSACNASYQRWLWSSPHASTAGIECPSPSHLKAVPAGLQTCAGVMVRATHARGGGCGAYCRSQTVVSLQSDLGVSFHCSAHLA